MSRQENPRTALGIRLGNRTKTPFESKPSRTDDSRETRVGSPPAQPAGGTKGASVRGSVYTESGSKQSIPKRFHVETLGQTNRSSEWPRKDETSKQTSEQSGIQER